MAWVDRLLAVVHTFTGRPTQTDTSATYQVRATPVNENFQGNMLAVAVCQALGTEVADNTSTVILCKLTLLAGRFEPGDRLTIIEDRPTLRLWCAVVTGTGAVPLVEFADAQLHDATLAGTADYNAIKDDLILLQTAPDDNAIWPKQSILLGGAHGLTGTDLPWKLGETDTIADKFDAAVGPAGLDTEIQFNDGGDMGGAAALLYKKSPVNSAIAGVGNTMNGWRSLIVGYYNNMQSDNGGPGGSLIAGDHCESVAGINNVYVLGIRAKASRDSQVVIANDNFAAVGDAQHTISLVRKVTTADATPTLVAAEPLEVGKSYTVRGRLIAQETGATVASNWTIDGGVANAAGTSRVLGGGASLVMAMVGQDGGAAAWVLNATINDGTDTLDVTVTGVIATNIGWVLMLELVENGY